MKRDEECGIVAVTAGYWEPDDDWPGRAADSLIALTAADIVGK